MRLMMAMAMAMALLLITVNSSYGQPTRVNVQTAGVLPGQDPAKNDAALEALIGRASGNLTLEFPGDKQDYTIYQSINIPDGLNLRVVGDGVSSRLVMYGGPNPVFMVGFGRTPDGKVLTANHGFELFGKLDGTAPWGPNQRFGYRTRDDSHIVQMNGPFSSTRYERLRRLTWEYIYDSSEIGEQSAPIAGVDGVWQLVDGPVWWLYFYTIDTPGGPPVRKALGFMGPTKVGVHRITIQLDLDKRSLVGWVDGVQAKGVGAWNEAVPVSLAANEMKTFGLGGTALSAFRHGNDWSNASNFDRAICGFAMYSGFNYGVGDETSRQQRLDGRAITDANRCFDGEADNLIGFLDLGTKPEGLANRWLTVIGRNGDLFRYTSAFVMSKEHDRPCYCPLVVDGMALESPGDCIAVGAALGIKLNNSAFASGEWGRAIGTWPGGANYFHRVSNCSLRGGEAAAYLHFSMWDFDKVDVPIHGRNTFWLRDSSVALRRIVSTGYGSPDRIVYATGCPRVVIDDMSVDIESAAYPAVCSIEARTSLNMGGYTEQLTVNDFNIGGPKGGVPLIKLGVMPGHPNWPARVDVSKVQFGARPDLMETILRVNGTKWFGTIDFSEDMKGKPLVLGSSNIRIIGPPITK